MTPSTKKPKRGEIWRVKLSGVVGSEMDKTRPCVIVSPDEINDRLNTVIIAPLTSKKRGWPFRPYIKAGEIQGEVALDQLRAIDKSRLLNKLENLSVKQLDQILYILREMFS